MDDLRRRQQAKNAEGAKVKGVTATANRLDAVRFGTFANGPRAKKENRLKKIVLVSVLVSVFVLALTGCGLSASDANVARYNLEVEEQNFRIDRRVVFYNGITGEYILTIEGKLAIIVDTDGDLVVTVKTSEGQYLKHYLGLSDNVTYFSEALRASDVSTSGYRVIFKPSVIAPTIELK